MKSYARVLCALLLAAGTALAQSAPLTVPGPERLPADTWVLINWHGVAAANKVRSTNPLMRLWDDPQFATSREQLIKKLVEEMARERKEGEEGVTREDLDDIVSLLENPALLGVAGDPFATALGGGEGVHVFALINKKGKEEVWARLDRNEKPKKNAEVSKYTFRGVEIKKTVTTTLPETAPPALKGPEEGKQDEPEAEEPRELKIRYEFAATIGDLEIYSDHQEVMEALITRLQEKAAPAESLLQNAAYQGAQRFRAEGAVLEAFVKIPDFSQLPYPPTPQMDTAAMVRELHLERMQGLWLSLGLAADRVLMRAALLGDMSPGSLLDIIGNNAGEFQTLAAAPASASFAAFRIDLPALYATVLRAAKAGLPPEQAAAADMVDGMVAMQTGLPLTELLGLFTGEMGTVSTGEEQLAEVLPDVIMIPVTKSEPVLSVLRLLAGTFIRGEQTASGATVLTMGAARTAEQGKPAEDRPLYVAVSPKMVVVSPGLPQMKDVLARSAAGNSAPAGSLAADATYQSVRKTMPAQLNGITYADLTRFPWEKQLEQMKKQLARQKQETLDRAEAAEKGDENNPPDPQRAEQLRAQAKAVDEMLPIFESVFPLLRKYFRISAGGSWKAPDGFFFHSFMN